MNPYKEKAKLIILRSPHSSWEDKINDIATELHQAYNDGLAKAAEIAESWWEVNYHERYTKAAIKEAIATAIREEMKK